MTTLDARSGDHLERLAVRLRRLSWWGMAAFLAVLTGYWYVQVAQGSVYRDLAENNRLRRTPIEASRGPIVDRNGRSLVENVPSYNLMFDRSQARDVSASLAFAAELLELEGTEPLRAIVERYRSSPAFKEILIAEDLTLVQVARFEVAELEHPEFRVEVLKRRLYRNGPQTAHLLGYLGEIRESEVAGRGLPPGEQVGREGVEQAFDDRLRGVDGEREVVVDSRGKIIDEVGRRPAESGEPLQLTIDIELQKEAAHLMADKVGAIVALDPRDGALRALVSAPSYDPNVFVRRLARDEWQAIVDDPHRPLQNRALQNVYAPGSVFKLVMAAAALAEGVSPERRVWCNGSIRLHDRRRRCWQSRGHGWMNLHAAVRESCDVYFYVVGNEMGIDRIAEWAHRFGFGQPTGVVLPGEKGGLVPDSRWSQEVRRSPWYPGETVSVAIGQGPLLVTPLQVAVSVAIAANGGRSVTPHLLVGEAPPASDLEIDPAAIAAVQDALRAVVNEQRGTGAAARVRGLEVAGKTGTAQVVEQKTWTRNEELAPEHRDHAWFASYAPTDEPELVVVVFVEHGGNGSRAAAPLAKALYEKYFELR